METGFPIFFKALKDLCFPPACLICGAWLAGPCEIKFCRPCLGKIDLIREPFCTCCGRGFPNAAGGGRLCSDCLTGAWHFSRARALFRYDDMIAKVVHSFKYGGRTTALSTFATVKERNNHISDLDEPDLIAPVPLHFKRLRQRGFNQALLLAKVFFPDKKKKIHAALVERHRWTEPQTGLNGAERRRNLKGAFSVKNPERLKGKRVLIIDDVFTTGTTVNECAVTLMRAGACDVQVMTLARVG